MLCKIGVLLASLVVACRTSELSLQNKFNGGHFKGEVSKVLIELVKRKLECAALCLRARPLCQSFNVRPKPANTDVPEDGGSFPFICEVLQEVPPSLTENIDLYFQTESGAAYYEMTYNSTMVQDNSTSSSRRGAHRRHIRQCWTEVTRQNASIIQEKYCLEGHGRLLSWDDALNVCVHDGGQLAEARNKAKHIAISAIGRHMITSRGHSQDTVTWIGGQGVFVGKRGDSSVTNKQWTWQDGTVITKFRWRFSEPNENDHRDCLSIIHSFTNDDVWEDNNCRTTMAVFVCEYRFWERL